MTKTCLDLMHRDRPGYYWLDFITHMTTFLDVYCLSLLPLLPNAGHVEEKQTESRVYVTKLPCVDFFGQPKRRSIMTSSSIPRCCRGCRRPCCTPWVGTIRNQDPSAHLLHLLTLDISELHQILNRFFLNHGITKSCLGPLPRGELRYITTTWRIMSACFEGLSSYRLGVTPCTAESSPLSTTHTLYRGDEWLPSESQYD